MPLTPDVYFFLPPSDLFNKSRKALGRKGLIQK